MCYWRKILPSLFETVLQMPLSFPRKRKSSNLSASHFWVPAYAVTTAIIPKEVSE